MSKRQPGSALNQDNWDAEEKPDEQGTWNRYAFFSETGFIDKALRKQL